MVIIASKKLNQQPAGQLSTLITPQVEEEFVQMADDLVEIDNGSCVTLELENCSHYHARLRKGTRLAEAVKILNWSETAGNGPGMRMEKKGQ